jgi:TolB protein
LDGKSLIYNSKGLLYNFDLATKIPTVIETDFANRNNNDHVISFDGKYLGISHHSDEDNGSSIIYTLPIGGGIPKRVTPLGPSYLHGWSADGKELIYTAQRNGQYDIYKISRFGGEEIQLTNTKGLDDGPEYTPDGKHIYFNSNRTGTMQIWRMKPNGTETEQMTFDAHHDWFGHVSPDGRWIVFLSFPKEIDSADHPFYKQIYLRSIPTIGGEPKVIGYVYGGQGTINVPSWSPDSKKIAFVSNTGKETLWNE